MPEVEETWVCRECACYGVPQCKIEIRPKPGLDNEPCGCPFNPETEPRWERLPSCVTSQSELSEETITAIAREVLRQMEEKKEKDREFAWKMCIAESEAHWRRTQEGRT